MIKSKKTFSVFYFILGLIVFLPSVSYAQCTSPASPAGRIEFFSAAGDKVHKYCDGTNWVPWAGRILSGIPAPQFSSSGLNNLTDVNVPTPADTECLKYDNASSKWINAACGGGGTPAGANTQIQFNNVGAFGGSANLTWDGSTITVTGDIGMTGGLNDISDIRLKENIQPVENSLEQIMKLQAISFTMKNDPKGRIEYGFSAQQMLEIFPVLVKTADNEMKTLSLNYMGLIAPMTRAIQEQQAIIDTQNTKIEDLDSRIQALEARYGTGRPKEKQSGEQ